MRGKSHKYVNNRRVIRRCVAYNDTIVIIYHPRIHEFKNVQFKANLNWEFGDSAADKQFNFRRQNNIEILCARKIASKLRIKTKEN